MRRSSHATRSQRNRISWAFACGLSLATVALPAHAQMAGPVDPDEPVPANHPGGGAASPHGGANANAAMTEPPPPFTVEEDEHLPAGSIAITILDADGKPRPRTNVTLGILHQSVAKGESREHKNATSTDLGAVAFDHLETGSGIAYRISVAEDGATFAASPFNLPQGKGMRVGLRVYPVTRDINQALVVMQTILYAELKDDRLQLQQVLTVYNFGRTAWVPNEVFVGLPEDYTALSASQQMSDVGIDPIDKKGARLRGTFAPGRQDVEFRWQLPYGGTSSIEIKESLPPHIAVARVMAAASAGMHLDVDGFPAPESHTDNQGQRILITEKQLRRDDPALTQLHVTMSELPTPGPESKIATVLSGFGMLFGIAFAAVSRRSARTKSDSGGRAGAKAEAKAAREELLAELENLERAHRAGDVGPKTYERARRELIDALARSLATREGAAGDSRKGTAASTATAGVSTGAGEKPSPP